MKILPFPSNDNPPPAGTSTRMIRQGETSAALLDTEWANLLGAAGFMLNNMLQPDDQEILGDILQKLSDQITE